ncbi:hypothetical protein UlMin_037973 [Ulmus minor]
MAAMLVQPPFRASHLVHHAHGASNKMRTQRLIPATNLKKKCTRFGECPSGLIPLFITRFAGRNSGLIGEEALTQIKTELYQALEGINRGIFGVPSKKKSEIEDLVKLLEAQNPTPDPTLNLEKVAGCWKLVYSTITILGSKRTKLGLRDFISLGDFFQIIDVDKSKAVNVIKFNVRGFQLFSGQLTIDAFFKPASKSRVDINYHKSNITPDQLMNVFRKNYDLLLSIFNPEGWLEITYVDDSLRIGRDNKGNFFILERSEDI